MPLRSAHHRRHVGLGLQPRRAGPHHGVVLRAALTTAAAALSACTALADFPPDRLDEATDALCGNYVDDDGDGLTDCQEWSCLAQPVCCNVPSVVLEDTFSGAACADAPCSDQDRSCAPDDDRWQRWGAPYPYQCEGALRIDKDFAGCYPVGAISQTAVSLEPGLRVEARVSGTPEIAGHLELGLTLQDAVIDGAEPCDTLAEIPTVASIVFADAEDLDGVEQTRLLALVAGEPIAEERTSASELDIAIEVTDEGTLAFTMGDSPTVETEDALPAGLEATVRVVVSGLGGGARLEQVRVVTGTRCEAPDAWTVAASATPLDPPPAGAWDEHQRSAPNARFDEREDELHLYYAGCESSGDDRCTALSNAVGHAVETDGGGLARPAADEPFPILSELLLPETVTRVPLDVHVIDGDVAYYGAAQDHLDEWVGLYRYELTELATPPDELLVPEPGWDQRSVCCPTVVDGEGGARMYYAGRAEDDGPSSIGLARSINDEPFVRVGPVITPGPDDSIHELGASQPWVLWDSTRLMYRMWFVATDELLRTSIGYAISTDGETWHVYDEAVVEPADVGASAIGHPTVIDDHGKLRMWVDGTPVGSVTKTIYELENVGVAPP